MFGQTFTTWPLVTKLISQFIETSDGKKFSILKKGIGIEGDKIIETS